MLAINLYTSGHFLVFPLALPIQIWFNRLLYHILPEGFQQKNNQQKLPQGSTPICPPCRCSFQSRLTPKVRNAATQDSSVFANSSSLRLLRLLRLSRVARCCLIYRVGCVAWQGGIKFREIDYILSGGFKDFFMFIPIWGNDPI